MFEREPAEEEGRVDRALRSPSSPLPSDHARSLAPAFGHDLSDVRIHDGRAAADAADALSARAFTFGRHIVLGAGVDLSSREGIGVLAHELGHAAAQPSADALPAQGYATTQRGDAAERQADAHAHAALTGAPAQPATRSATPFLARQEIEVDLEVPPPAEAERLRAQGIRLPAVSAAAADPRTHSDWIERRLVAVGFGIYLGGYLAYCDGLPLPIFVPDSHVDFGLTSAAMDDPAIHLDRTDALASIPAGPPMAGAPATHVAFYRGAGGAVIAPTIFSPATTPQFVATALSARQELARQVQEELTALAVGLLGGMLIRAGIGIIARIGRGFARPPRLLAAGAGRALGRTMAEQMRAEGFRGNPFREFARRLNALPRRLPPEEAAEAIAVATRTWDRNMGTMPPVQQGQILVVPSRAPIPNAPVMGIRGDGSVIIGRAPRIEIVRTPTGAPVLPVQGRIVGDITWE